MILTTLLTVCIVLSLINLYFLTKLGAFVAQMAEVVSETRDITEAIWEDRQRQFPESSPQRSSGSDRGLVDVQSQPDYGDPRIS